MSDKSKIEWTDATWNPVTGCSKVSEGCRNCYALTFAERFRGTPGHYFEKGFDVTLRPDMLDRPLRWRRPRRIFVNSMSDLFHREVPELLIHEVFRVMAEANWHTFQILTKRPERMREVIGRLGRQFDGMVFNGSKVTWPLPNVWIGVSVENQQAADERIPLLLQTPAAVRFLSCEPLLGDVNITHIDEGDATLYPLSGYFHGEGMNEPVPIKRGGIGWVIVGGESGHKARPLHPEWVRDLRDQCQSAGVPFFFKQWGEWAPFNSIDPRPDNTPRAIIMGKETVWRVGKKATGRLLDGRTWDEYPEEESPDA